MQSYTLTHAARLDCMDAEGRRLRDTLHLLKSSVAKVYVIKMLTQVPTLCCPFHSLALSLSLSLISFVFWLVGVLFYSVSF